MADIKTEKTSVVVLNDPQPQYMQLGLTPGVVHIKIKNEGVLHDAHLQPDEAVQLGVALIQGGQQAMLLLMQAKAGAPPLTNGKPRMGG